MTFFRLNEEFIFRVDYFPSVTNNELAGFGWEHKHEYRQTCNQHAGNDKINRVEEGLPLNDQIKSNTIDSIFISLIVMFSR